MATVSQITANRANARKSTGPKTPAGKVRSSQNALRHGLASRQIVLNTEDETAFQALYAEFLDEYQPADATERILVQQVAIAAWRLRRIQTLETVLFDYRFVLEPGLWSSEASGSLQDIGALERQALAAERFEGMRCVCPNATKARSASGRAEKTTGSATGSSRLDRWLSSVSAGLAGGGKRRVFPESHRVLPECG